MLPRILVLIKVCPPSQDKYPTFCEYFNAYLLSIFIPYSVESNLEGSTVEDLRYFGDEGLGRGGTIQGVCSAEGLHEVKIMR